jgi:hypothetical protein
MPSNTLFVALKSEDLSALYVNFNAQGIAATCAPNTVTNLDYTLVDDCEITGIHLITNNSNYGDFANLQIVDSSGIFTGIPGTIIKQFVTNWYVSANSDSQFDTQYPAKIYAGMTIRVVYHSTALIISPFIAINYKLHKILN